MNKYYKQIINEDELGLNPYLATLLIPVRVWNKKVKSDTGEIITDELDFEYTKYVKVYKKPANRKVINSLSDKAQRLYLWLLQVTQEGEKYLWLNRELYTEENNIKSNTTIVNAIKELVTRQIISKTGVTNYYWINPEFFFSGSRLKAYPGNCRPYQELIKNEK